ncbi:DUF6233 domain-containing protein [Streptomyces olivaceoviridis]|uniref:DUF6233 domain-containing protein n=1 Tax=Streptomyces olivaceoviridis TaxID=1921 RepID=A0ABW7VEG9_STROI|nr:DUF6233 domain-containing protein [Streptomyces corchorusii]
MRPAREAGTAGLDRRTRYPGRPAARAGPPRAPATWRANDTRPVSPEEARRLLTDDTSACSHCRPGTAPRIVKRASHPPGMRGGRASAAVGVGAHFTLTATVGE